MTLHVFTMLNGSDTVIAESEECAWAIWEQHCGERAADYTDVTWVQRPDDELLTVWLDEAFNDCDCQAVIDEFIQVAEQQRAMLTRLPKPARDQLAMAIRTQPSTYPNGHIVGCKHGRVTKTCAQWVDTYGPGFLGSKEV